MNAVPDRRPRGIRNNNMGNVEYNPGVKWKGLADPPTDGRFCRFKEPWLGVRCTAKVLLTYYRKHKLRTVHAIIERWAPPEVKGVAENDTMAYARAVAGELFVGIHEVIDCERLGTMMSLTRAICHHENAGYDYPTVTYARGVAEALGG